jgi:hypothetical protein
VGAWGGQVKVWVVIYGCVGGANYEAGEENGAGPCAIEVMEWSEAGPWGGWGHRRMSRGEEMGLRDRLRMNEMTGRTFVRRFCE